MAPTFVAAGTVAVGTTGTITPAYPAGILANDILLDIAESVGGSNYATPAGWAHVSSNGTPVSPVIQTTNTQLTVFWRRYDGTGTAPGLTGPTDHKLGRMIAIRGCPLTGNPWNIVTTTNSATSSTAATWPGATTTVIDTLVLEIIATGVDPAADDTAGIGALTNAAYTSITERVDNRTTSGNGGSIAVISGIKATASATGSSTATLATAATKAYMTLAMMNAPAATGTRYDRIRRTRRHPSYRR
jgi:hypothetical protein